MPYDTYLGRICDERRPHNTAWYASREYLRDQHHERKRRMYKQVTCDRGRRFKAVALPDTSGAGLYDLEGFEEQGHLSLGPISFCYSDGAHRHRDEAQDGLLASAVVYRNGNGWNTRATALPRYSGVTKDAEIYALKMALDIAIEHTRDPHRSFENVVIFFDCQDVVQMLAGEPGCRHSLGPIPESGQWALDDLYDAAAELHAAGKSVVVAWIRAHKSGIGNEGNRIADRAANSNIRCQTGSFYSHNPILCDLPNWAKDLEGDV
ncbi:hypothetical protein CC86DRAFT_201718 [Ophiobolus disseminans]|uniref:RNase H type-1 domain-containing protein n=1 Tax=Ophiobolus disseminans TaxID=1469910 RepID=A0A6A7A3L7_9PLEO|nr:hypothetical protein CC86DRAFT_201718 [Ophiobolus disseminans]